MDSRISVAAAIFVLTMSCGISDSSAASQSRRDGTRLSEVPKLHRHHKITARSATDGRGFQDESYAGYRTDVAGNRYFYYRVSGDTPFGAGKVLPPPYPR